MNFAPNPTGYEAIVEQNGYRMTIPVTGFDDAGEAMICNPRGRLVTAAGVVGFKEVRPVGLWIHKIGG